MPTVLLKGCSPAVPALDHDAPAYSKDDFDQVEIQEAAHTTQKRRARLLELAAGLNPCTARTKLTGFEDQVGSRLVCISTCSRPYPSVTDMSCHQAALSGQSSGCVHIPPAPLQPDLCVGVLAVLPPGLLSWELDTACSGPLLAAAGRFSQLEQLSIPGNAAAIDWRMHRHAAVRRALSMLTRLRVECREPGFVQDVDQAFVDCDCQPIPDAFPAALAAAARLERLTVEACWSPAVVTLCAALPPSLRQFE